MYVLGHSPVGGSVNCEWDRTLWLWAACFALHCYDHFSAFNVLRKGSRHCLPDTAEQLHNNWVSSMLNSGDFSSVNIVQIWLSESLIYLIFPKDILPKVLWPVNMHFSKLQSGFFPLSFKVGIFLDLLPLSTHFHSGSNVQCVWTKYYLDLGGQLISVLKFSLVLFHHSNHPSVQTRVNFLFVEMSMEAGYIPMDLKPLDSISKRKIKWLEMVLWPSPRTSLAATFFKCSDNSLLFFLLSLFSGMILNRTMRTFPDLNKMNEWLLMDPSPNLRRNYEKN